MTNNLFETQYDLTKKYSEQYKTKEEKDVNVDK